MGITERQTIEEVEREGIENGVDDRPELDDQLSNGITPIYDDLHREPES
jgi:hypothetical protein